MKVICDQCGKEYESGKEVFQDLFGYCINPDENICDACHEAERIQSLLREGLILEYKHTQTGL